MRDWARALLYSFLNPHFRHKVRTEGDAQEINWKPSLGSQSWSRQGFCYSSSTTTAQHLPALSKACRYQGERLPFTSMGLASQLAEDEAQYTPTTHVVRWFGGIWFFLPSGEELSFWKYQSTSQETKQNHTASQQGSGVRSSQALGDMGTTPHQTQAVGKSTLTHGSHSILANARAENVTLEYHFEWLWEQTQHSFSTLIQQMIWMSWEGLSHTAWLHYLIDFCPCSLHYLWENNSQQLRLPSSSVSKFTCPCLGDKATPRSPFCPDSTTVLCYKLFTGWHSIWFMLGNKYV